MASAHFSKFANLRIIVWIQHTRAAGTKRVFSVRPNIRDASEARIVRMSEATCRTLARWVGHWPGTWISLRFIPATPQRLARLRAASPIGGGTIGLSHQQRLQSQRQKPRAGHAAAKGGRRQDVDRGTA